MRNFVIFVQGENYNLEVEGKVQLAGFFATRRAEAESEEEASEIVLNQLINEPELCAATTVPGAKPSINVKVAHEMPLEHKNEYTGFTFYPMEEE
ncbi:MAG: hypothetical protein N0C88_04560 [Candidatus Thiodiazotropha lotti]|uniref:Uncharacterized protein n=1 Tax=Candidatus Thiodiazotropha lotti TaxID=2792787 RepID=A0A9E4K3J9_9GAMM|nr:hypothetical protein [Candidatus Thiodiazotropha lotti]MCW4202582.1 hypothetical protein [Candidatus Thiodiazotropha lotti]